MALTYLLSSACMAALCSLVLTGGGAYGEAAVPGRARRTARHALLRLLRRIASLPLFEHLLENRVWGSLAAEVRDSSFGRRLGLGEREAGALLAVGFVGTCVLSALLFASVIAGVVVAIALIAGCVARDSNKRRRAREEAAAEMPGIYRTLSVAMGAGQTLAQAVDYVGSHEQGLAAAVFAKMSLRLRCGVSTEEAVEKLAEELDAPGTELLSTALVISHRTGCPLRELLLRSARLVERQGEFERLLSVKTAQVRLSVKIVCLLPVILIGILALISPDFQEGLFTPVGAGSVLLALVLDGVALLIINHLVKGVLR